MANFQYFVVNHDSKKSRGDIGQARERRRKQENFLGVNLR